MFVERIEILLKEKKITKKKFLGDLGLAIGSFSNWRDRGTIPSGKTLQQISDYLGVSVNYLLGEENTAPKNEDGVITDPLEARLMESVRQLSDDQKKLLLAQLDILLADKEK